MPHLNYIIRQPESIFAGPFSLCALLYVIIPIQTTTPHRTALNWNKRNEWPSSNIPLMFAAIAAFAQIIHNGSYKKETFFIYARQFDRHHALTSLALVEFMPVIQVRTSEKTLVWLTLTPLWPKQIRNVDEWKIVIDKYWPAKPNFSHRRMGHVDVDTHDANHNDKKKRMTKDREKTLVKYDRRLNANCIFRWPMIAHRNFLYAIPP